MASEASLLEQFDAEWPNGSWSIDRTFGNNRWGAYVHGFGTCVSGHGATPREAFDSAVAKFRAEYPDEMTAKRDRLAKARAEAERLERELGEAA